MPRYAYCTRCADAFPASVIKRGLCPRCAAVKDRERLAAEPWRAAYSTPMWRAVRAATLRRAAYRCEARTDGERCPVGVGLEAHHLVPLRDGGEPYDLDNVVALCARHHRLAEMAVRA